MSSKSALTAGKNWSLGDRKTWRLLAHRHWITLRIRGREIRLCARCTGFVLSFFVLQAAPPLSLFLALGSSVQIAISALFALPLAIDWITQAAGLRESNNKMRFFTGTMVAVGTSLLSYSSVTYQIRTTLYFFVAITILLAGLLARHRT